MKKTLLTLWKDSRVRNQLTVIILRCHWVKKEKKLTVVANLENLVKPKSHPDIRQDKGLMWSFQMWLLHTVSKRKFVCLIHIPYDGHRVHHATLPSYLPHFNLLFYTILHEHSLTLSCDTKTLIRKQKVFRLIKGHLKMVCHQHQIQSSTYQTKILFTAVEKHKKKM